MHIDYEDDRFVARTSDASEMKRLHRDGWQVLRTSAVCTSDPMKALPHWSSASAAVQLRLAALKGECDASAATTWTGSRLLLPDDEELHPYQSAGVRYALNRRHALVADEPGLGKTPTAIVIANEAKAKRILVVCPASVRRQWAKQIARWSLDASQAYVVESARNGVSPLAKWTIISYDLAAGALLGRLQTGGWDYIVLDEAHYLKSATARRTVALFGNARHTPLVDGVERVVCLTGTPMPNRPGEIFTIARALDWGSIDYMSEFAFAEAFNPPVQLPTGGTVYRARRLDELGGRLRSSFMVRRRKRDVLTQLPAVQYEMLHTEETGAIRKALKAETLLGLDVSQPDFGAAKFDGAVSTVRREMGMAKAPLVADMVADMLDGGEDKIVLFGWHRDVLDVWAAKLERFNPARIDGGTSAPARAEAVRRFREDSKCRVIYGNLQSMGTGVDGLQDVCSTVVLGEMSWVPGENEQGVDRLNRIGQQTAVRALFVVAAGSIDEKIFASSHGKAKNIGKALDTAA